MYVWVQEIASEIHQSPTRAIAVENVQDAVNSTDRRQVDKRMEVRTILSLLYFVRVAQVLRPLWKANDCLEKEDKLNENTKNES